MSTPQTTSTNRRPDRVGSVAAVEPPGLLYVPKQAATPPPAVFPSGDLVGMAAATLAASAGCPLWDGAEGPRWFVVISPGSVRISSTDLARGERTRGRAASARTKVVDLSVAVRLDNESKAAARLLAAAGVVVDQVGEDDADPLDDRPGSRAITAWSRKSRANMTKRLVTLDYNPLVDAGDPVALTLTYPGDWLTVAPNGRAVKRHLNAFRRRWQRRFGAPLAVWKMEWQRRGAPHFHLMMAKPAGISLTDFRVWVATAWSAVLNHPDPEQRAAGLLAGTQVTIERERMRDPKRVGIYFSKHGIFSAKDYQNDPPAEWTETGDSVGRLWGYWGLEPVESYAAVTPRQAVQLARTLRRSQRHKRFLRPVTVWRTEQSTGRMRKRTVRRPVIRMPNTAGFLAVNDGPSMAMMLDRILTSNTGENTR